MSEQRLLRIYAARHHVWKAVKDREGGGGRIGCNFSSCEQACGLGMFLFAWVSKQMLLPVVWLGVAGE